MEKVTKFFAWLKEFFAKNKLAHAAALAGVAIFLLTLKPAINEQRLPSFKEILTAIEAGAVGALAYLIKVGIFGSSASVNINNPLPSEENHEEIKG